MLYVSVVVPEDGPEYIAGVFDDPQAAMAYVRLKPPEVRHSGSRMDGGFPVWLVELKGHWAFAESEEAAKKLPDWWTIYRLDGPWTPKTPWADEMGSLPHEHAPDPIMAAYNDDKLRAELEKRFGIKREEGWDGAFTRLRSPLAKYDNGLRIAKSIHEEGDLVKLGTLGTILGSMDWEGQVAYFVEWSNQPKRAVLVRESKVSPATVN